MHQRIRNPVVKAVFGLALACGVLAWSAVHAADAPAAALPGDSVYQLKVPLSDQDGRAFTLKDLRGKPVLVSMFYNSCEFVCPMLIDTMRMTGKELSPAQRDKLQNVLVTFDPARDTTEVLKDVLKKHELDAAHWRLLRPNATGARQIGSALGIQYRQLGGGDFNHTTVLILLDGEGRVVGKTKQMGEVDQAFVALVKKTLR